MPVPSDPAVLELRRYTLRPGRRDDLVDLFERAFVESQEAVDMALPGQFRDLDDPDRFTWFRGFADGASRGDALAAFYGGPVWRAHREEANATMLDSDDVLLLRPVAPGSGFPVSPGARPAIGAAPVDTVVGVTIAHLPRPADDSLRTLLTTGLAPAMPSAPVAMLETAYIANGFPALPVREDAHVAVVVTRHESLAEHDRDLGVTRALPASEELRRRAVRVESLRLAPTARSLLR